MAIEDIRNNLEQGDSPQGYDFWGLIDEVYNQTDGLGFATTTKVESNPIESHPTKTTRSAASIFTGWASEIGDHYGVVRYIKFYIHPWDAGNIPTQVKARIRNGKGGSSLVDKTVNLSNLTLNEQNEVIIDFGVKVDLTGIDAWFEFTTDGKTGVVCDPDSSTITVWTINSGSNTQYTVNGSVDSPAWTNMGDGTIYRIYADLFLKYVPDEVNFTQQAADNIKPLIEQVTFNIPPRIDAVVGYQTQIFHKGLIESINPYSLNLRISGDVGGKQYPRYYDFTPSSAGSHTMNIALHDNKNNEMLSGSIPVNFYSAVQQPATEKKVMIVGDSLTGVGTWVAEFNRLLTGTGGSPAGLNYSNIQLIGTRGSGSDLHEGYSGRDWDFFVSATAQSNSSVTAASHGKDGSDITSIWQDANTNQWRLEEVTSANVLVFSRVSHSSNLPANGTLTHVSGSVNTANITFTSWSGGTTNPFWNSGLDFTNYVTTNGFGTIDIVYCLMTWNSMAQNRTTVSDFQYLIDDVTTFLDALKSDYPSVELKLMGIPLPSPNGGISKNYGDDSSAYGNYYGLVRSVFGLNKAYKSIADDVTYSSWVEFIDVCSQFDNDYNYPTESLPVNSRNTQTEDMQSNGVHPNDAGYYQIADVAFRNFVKNYCQ